MKRHTGKNTQVVWTPLTCCYVMLEMRERERSGLWCPVTEQVYF